MIPFLACTLCKAQGIVRGKVTDNTGEPLIAASIILKNNRAVGANTDLTGSYSLSIPDSSEQIILISYIGFKIREEHIQAKKGAVIIRNITLFPNSDTLKTVVISAKAVKAKEYYMEQFKMNSSVTLDYISAETMKKTGDVNVVSAVARVSGVSTNGGFISVRGIGDRYIKTAINGARIPTLDPFTNNIKLDLFPASLVDNVIVMKTASPDLPGDWAGAYLSIETKDYPDKFSINVETSFGYNNQSSFQDVVTTPANTGGNFNTRMNQWLGFTNGYNEINPSSFTNLVMEPTLYQEFVALGLGNYFKSIGVTANTPWTDNYYKLALIQLGLLGKAEINDNTAFNNAKTAFQNGPYYGMAYHVINDAAVKSSRSFPNNWSTGLMKAPLDFSQNFSIGNQVNLFKRPLGILAGFRYSSIIQSDPNSFINTLMDSKMENGKPVDYDATTQKITRETKGWSALVNLAYKLSPNNSISLLFMPNVKGVNNVRDGYQTNTLNTYSAYQTNAVENQFFESRQQMVYQLKSENYLPRPKMKIDVNASYTNGVSNAPDFKVLNLPPDSAHRNQLDFGADRYYRYLTDHLFDSHISAEIPVNSKPGLSRKIKFGGGYQWESKTSDQYDYSIKDGPYASQFYLGNEASDPFSPDKFNIGPVIDANGLPSYSVQKTYQEYGLPTDHTIGLSTLSSAYVMTDYALTRALRFSGGLRIEQAYIHTDVRLFDSLGLARNDQRRYIEDYGIINPGELNATSYLPSAGIIYKLNKNETSPVNIRLNFSQTVARPSIRELSGVSVYDYELKDQVTGNPDLKMVQINNYDFRIESFFKSGDNVSFSLFYKDFTNHIELVRLDPYGFYWVNNPNKSWLQGMEVEGKKVLGKYLDLRANISLVDSRSTFVENFQFGNGTEVKGPTVTHTMYGQAPWVVNGILTFHSSEKFGLTATATYNIQGPKLVIEASPGIPPVYERPRNLVDFTISKTLGRHFSINLKIRDLLNAPYVRSYKFDQGYLLDYDRYQYGTTYVIGLLYQI